MKKIITVFIVCVTVLCTSLTAFAADGAVVYSGSSGDFIFAPGSEYSPTDLFANFKDVMPGDSITQKITVKNAAENDVKVKIYMRSLGAHEDSVEFLSKLLLTVTASAENEMAYMFDAEADKTAQLTDWVCLGTLYSGGKVDLDVTLDVPVELSNEFQKEIGYLDWEFMVEEFPVEEGDPVPPQTGDDPHMIIWFTVLLCSLTTIIILLIWRKKNKESKETTKTN